MKRTITSALALLVLIAGVAGAERYTPVQGSMIRIEGTSSLHAWKMEGTTISGQITAPTPDKWENGLDSTSVSVSIPVTSIRSEHKKMDKLMSAALKAEKNPEVRFDLTTAALENSGASTFVVETSGKLTIAGVTRDVDMKVAGVRAGSTYTLTGSVPIRMSDYGIKPPTAMLGTIRTGNDVTVSFRWLIAATQN